MLDRLKTEAFSLTMETSHGLSPEPCFQYYTSPVYKYLDQICQRGRDALRWCCGNFIYSRWLTPIYKLVRFVVSCVYSIIKILVYIALLPLGCAALIRQISVMGMLPAVLLNKNFGLQGFDEDYRNDIVRNLEISLNRKYQGSAFKICRTPVRVDDMLVDAVTLISKPNSNRWVLASSCNTPSYEMMFEMLEEDILYSMSDKAQSTRASNNVLADYQDGALISMINWAQQMNANIMFYNYPGVALSQSRVSVANLTKAHRGCVNYLLDDTNGPGAEEILCYGFSLGGCVQAESLYRMSKQEKEKIKLVVTDRSGHDLSLVAGRFVADMFKKYISISARVYNILKSIGSFLFKLTRLNMKPYECNKSLSCPELYITVVDDNFDVKDDGVFDETSSYAVACINESNENIRSRKRQVNLVGATHSSGFDSNYLTSKSQLYLSQKNK